MLGKKVIECPEPPNYADNPKKTRANGPVKPGPKKTKPEGASPHDRTLNTWSDEEKAVIEWHIDDKDANGAWEDYQKKFPGKRNKNAIYQRWHVTRGKKKAPVRKKPSSSVSTSSGQSSGDVITRYEGDGKGPALANGTMINIQGAEGLDEIPQEPAPVTLDKFSPSENIVGWKVKQIKADGGRQVFGTATVIARRRSGLIEVRNGGGKVHTIRADALAVVPAGKEGADAAAGEMA